MPENLKALRNRIRSIAKTKKITRAMEMVAAAKLRKTQHLMESSRPYINKMQEVLERLVASLGTEEHEFFRRPETGEPLLVAFTSDRGLCGAFNANIVKLAGSALRENPDMRVFVIGRKGRDLFRRYFPDRIVGEMVDLGTEVDGALTDKIADQLMDEFRDGKWSSIDIVYGHFISAAVNKPVQERFLPMEAPEVEEETPEEWHTEYLLEPTPQRVMDALLPRYLRSKIFLVQAESFTSEYSSRMLAMNNATKNCDELGETLTLRLNKARQAAITTEIVEVVSGAEALQG